MKKIGEGYDFRGLSSAERQDLRTVPGTNSPPAPGTVALPQSSQRLRVGGLAFLNARGNLVAHGGICRLHTAQLCGDLRGNYETGKLPGEKIDRYQSN